GLPLLLAQTANQTVCTGVVADRRLPQLASLIRREGALALHLHRHSLGAAMAEALPDLACLDSLLQLELARPEAQLGRFALGRVRHDPSTSPHRHAGNRRDDASRPAAASQNRPSLSRRVPCAHGRTRCRVPRPSVEPALARRAPRQSLSPARRPLRLRPPTGYRPAPGSPSRGPSRNPRPPERPAVPNRRNRRSGATTSIQPGRSGPPVHVPPASRCGRTCLPYTPSPTHRAGTRPKYHVPADRPPDPEPPYRPARSRNAATPPSDGRHA